MRKLWLVVLALAMAGMSLGLVACDDDDDEGDGGEEVSLDLVIGDSLPLTGLLGAFGPPGQKGADLAADEINAAIEEAGVDHTVEVVHEDNETDTQAATQAARKLVADGASCIAGAWASGDTIATARSVTVREEVLLISPASTADEITDLDDDGLVNRTSPPDRFQGPTLAEAISEDLGGAEGRTVNIGAQNTPYGTGLADTFAEGWEALGGEIGQRQIYDVDQPSYNSEAQRITSGNPDAIVIIDYPEPFDKVGPALERTGNWDPTIAWGTDGIYDTGTAEAQADILEGMRGTFPGVPEGRPASDAFDQLFDESEPRDVARQAFDAQNFDAVITCYLAAVAAGSTEGADMAAEVQDLTSPGGAEYTWEELPEAIEALQNGDDIDYVGASGGVDINEDGDATSEVYDIYEFTDGEVPVIEELPVVIPEE
jgi:ABC-type branched-subunit amino acid transport system substrate-binding protein